ncbi:MAG: bifunctional hydroxymethylpyrimidine kinase/phosphomethylpyrimidine kinase [Verrucomicrobia bacterium]|nr:bifunctional hydroxymethylpyrimidine kinase/phosphomethylpyrimidine kinase [Verrucomicrobiota bacterium]
MKILCCGFFPALQRTIQYDAFRPYEVNRARNVSIAASGKATNTARVLKTLGADPLVLSFAGGGNGKTVRDLLEQEQIPCRWVETKAETRICQTLLSGNHDGCTELVENTEALTAAEWKAFVKTFAGLQGGFDRIIFSGNLPPHAPQDIYAELLSLTDGKKVLIDSYGPPLLAALEHRPAVVKINAEELRNTFKSKSPVGELAEELMSLGAGAIGITQGKDQAMLFAPGTANRFTVPVISAVNPIGSGDSVSAGISCALAKGHSLTEAFVFGLACGTSNAMNLNPGCVKLDQIAAIVPEIKAGK